MKMKSIKTKQGEINLTNIFINDLWKEVDRTDAEAIQGGKYYGDRDRDYPIGDGDRDFDGDRPFRRLLLRDPD